MPELKIINGKDEGPPATIEQLAAMEFKGVKKLAQMPKEERTSNIRSLAMSVYQAAAVAGELYIRDKAEVVEMVREKYDTYDPALMELSDAGKDAEALLDIIRTGETRLAVALAIVEGEN